MFDNRLQSIPERFIAKQNIDREVRSCYESNLTRKDNVVFVDDMLSFREEMKPLKEEQRRLWVSCDNLIKENKPRGGGLA